MEHAYAVAAQPQSVRPKWLALAAASVLIGLVLRDGWVTEDAYITLRTVDNWVNGAGLRWNADERVQGYTHPLWMLLLSVGYYLTREGYLTAILSGVLTTLAAVLLLIRCARSAGHAAAAVVLLCLSRSFIEYSTAGLENPLTHLLVAVFVWLYAVRPAGLRALTLSAALLALNRSDAVIVAVPALLHVTWLSLREHGLKRTALDLLAGLSPYLAWEAFSLFYYGFLFPNTAYAKLNTGLPRWELLRQGLTYVLNALAWDPPILTITALGIGTAFLQRRLRDGLLGLGIVLYLIYVLQIGGDFMLGRFFTLPFFMSVCVIAISLLPLEEPTRFAVVVAPFFLLFWHPTAIEKYPIGDFHHSGVADERTYYRDAAALMMLTRTRPLPAHVWAVEGRMARAKQERVKVSENVGLLGFFAGPTVHIVDPLALTEPLLARLPSRYDPNWRVGHYRRVIPDGYVDTITTGSCRMPDRNLCEYYAQLKNIISGDLWSFSRLKTIVAMNFGRYDYLVDRDRYRFPSMLREELRNLSAPVEEWSAWDGPGTRTFGLDGIEIAIGRVSHAQRIDLALDGNDLYEIELRNGNTSVAVLPSPSIDLGMMHTRSLLVPKDAYKEGFDHILIHPVTGDGFYSVAFVRLVR